MVNTVPNNLVVSASCYTSTDCEDQLTVECLLQEIKHLSSLLVIGQVGSSMCSWKTDISSFATIHTIVYCNSSDIFEAVAVHKVTGIPSHASWRLISYHLSKDGGTDWTSDPIFVAFEVIEAPFVQEMGAAETNNIVIRFLNKLVLIIFWLFILKLANTAFIMRRFFVS